MIESPSNLEIDENINIHMNAKLISYSKPFEKMEGVNDAKDLIAYCARVSNPSNQTNDKTAEKLLRYLKKHKHWSPFEMVSACLEIETTRDIARQILRHRSFSFQEFSQRYANPVEELEFALKECRLQDYQNRQNSIEIESDPNTQGDQRLTSLIVDWQRKQRGIINQAKAAYEWAIENGIAKEQARAVLPEGLTVSRLYMNGTLRSWIHFIELRCGPETQKEHRQVAFACAKAIAEIFPDIR